MEFTDEQVRAIVEKNLALQNFQAGKLRRTAQVQIELAQETAKTPIDPMALGLRHLELEAIRRELHTEQEKTTTAIQNILTPAQKLKLQALQQAMQLQPVICEAQALNLLGGLPEPAFGRIIRNPFPGNIIPVARIDAGAFLLPSATCAPANRIGSFSQVIPAPPTQP